MRKRGAIGAGGRTRALAGALAVAALAMPGSGIAQMPPERSEEALEALLRPVVVEASPLRFEVCEVALGAVGEEEGPCRRRFSCTNVGATPVVITRVTTGCHCLAGRWSAEPIAPGGTGVVELTFDPANHPGRIDERALVYIAGMGGPAACLTLTGEVRPSENPWARYRHAMGPLHLKQREVTFRASECRGRASARILCGNGGGRPLRLAAEVIPPCATFRTEPETIGPGEEADIVITVDMEALPAGEGEKVVLPVVVGGIGGRPSDRTLTVTVYRN